jgi:PPM family protein phosphatase
MSGTELDFPPVEVFDVSDPGRDPDKRVNEDSCRHGETPFGYLIVLCDGMGGHEAGREASMLAVETVFRAMNAAAVRVDLPFVDRAREVLRDAVMVANSAVHGMRPAGGTSRPGSTLVATLSHAYGTEIAHVGDSRCYLLHEGVVSQVTRDHSVVQDLVDSGQITAAEAKDHPDSNRITRALGATPVVDVELAPRPITHVVGDVFVLCSDGLSDLVSAEEILRLAGSSPPREAARQLVDLANERGGHDNITAIVAAVRKNVVTVPDVPSRPSSGVAPTLPMIIVPASSSGSLPAASSSRHTVPMSVSERELPRPPAPLPTPPKSRIPVIAVLVAVVMFVLTGGVITWVGQSATPTLSVDAGADVASAIVFPAASLNPTVAPVPGEDYDESLIDAGQRPRRGKGRGKH